MMDDVTSSDSENDVSINTKNNYLFIKKDIFIGSSMFDIIQSYNNVNNLYYKYKQKEYIKMEGKGKDGKK